MNLKLKLEKLFAISSIFVALAAIPTSVALLAQKVSPRNFAFGMLALATLAYVAYKIVVLAVCRIEDINEVLSKEV